MEKSLKQEILDAINSGGSSWLVVSGRWRCRIFEGGGVYEGEMEDTATGSIVDDLVGADAQDMAFIMSDSAERIERKQ